MDSKKKPFALLTDMWFDDLGALSILNANGALPDSITTVTGMMSPELWTERYAEILQAWNISVPIYESNILCSNNKCQQPGWGRANAKRCDGGVGDCSHLKAEVYDRVVNSSHHLRKEFAPPTWKSLCPAAAGCTILSLGTLTELDHAITELSSLPGSVDRVIISGAFFEESREGLLMAAEDPQSAANLGYPDLPNFPHYSMDVAKGGIETNYFADPNADASFLAHLPSNAGLVLVPYPVSGMCRIGMQTLLKKGVPVTYGMEADVTKAKAKALCNISDFPQGARPLHDVACLYRPGDNVLLDADAITSNIVNRPDLFTFKKQLVSFNGTNGQTLGNCVEVPHGVQQSGSLISCICPGDVGRVRLCARASVATDFDSIRWYEHLESLLRGAPAGKSQISEVLRASELDSFIV